MSGRGHTHLKKKSKAPRSRLLEYREDEETEIYGKITKKLGNCFFEFENINTSKMGIAKARGALIKGRGRDPINIDSVVLIQCDTTSSINEKYYIINVYTKEEQKKLQDCGELDKVVGIIDESINQDTVVAFKSDLNNATTKVIDDDFFNNI
jgi:hypothetical protein